MSEFADEKCLCNFGVKRSFAFIQDLKIIVIKVFVVANGPFFNKHIKAYQWLVLLKNLNILEILTECQL